MVFLSSLWFDGNAFTLAINFTAPSAGSGTFSALITGEVSPGPDGGVFIDFDNTPQAFEFNNGYLSGWLTFNVNDLSIHHGQTESLSGNVFVTPEPGSCLAVATGVIALLRRRAKAKAAK